MGVKEEEGALLTTSAIIFVGRALKLLMVWVVPEAFVTPLGQQSLTI